MELTIISSINIMNTLFSVASNAIASSSVSMLSMFEVQCSSLHYELRYNFCTMQHELRTNCYDYHIGISSNNCMVRRGYNVSTECTNNTILKRGSWTSRTPANSYPRQEVPEIRDSRLVPSLLGCLPSRTRVVPVTGRTLKLVPYFNIISTLIIFSLFK